MVMEILCVLEGESSGYCTMSKLTLILISGTSVIRTPHFPNFISVGHQSKNRAILKKKYTLLLNCSSSIFTYKLILLFKGK